MKNFIELGESITVTAVADVVSGVPVIINGLFLVPKQDAATGEQFAAMFRGGFIFDKATGVAVTQFEPAYFDTGNSNVTNVANANLIGVFLDAGEAGATGATVLLTGELQVETVSSPAGGAPPVDSGKTSKRN